MVADYFDKYHFEENQDEYEGKMSAVVESQDSSSTALTGTKRLYNSNREEVHVSAAEDNVILGPVRTLKESPAKKRRIIRSSKEESN